MLLDRRHLGRADVQRQRHQQWLTDDAPAGVGGAQALVGDALVRGVHVDQHQAARALGQDVDAHQLRQRSAERLLGGLVAVGRQPLPGQDRAARKLRVSLELFG